MIRWICGRLGRPDGIATAEAVLADVDGRRERATIMLPDPGKPEDVVPGHTMAREPGPVPDGDGWIGVLPLLAGEVIATGLGYGTLT
jgi:hypothetical protein